MATRGVLSLKCLATCALELNFTALTLLDYYNAVVTEAEQELNNLKTQYYQGANNLDQIEKQETKIASLQSIRATYRTSIGLSAFPSQAELHPGAPRRRRNNNPPRSLPPQ